jgi:hypothetical protein
VEVFAGRWRYSFYNTSTKRSSNLAPSDEISKSGDGECSGDIFGAKGSNDTTYIDIE